MAYIHSYPPWEACNIGEAHAPCGAIPCVLAFVADRVEIFGVLDEEKDRLIGTD